jgi:DNA-binding response OmpR family regulator
VGQSKSIEKENTSMRLHIKPTRPLGLILVVEDEPLVARGISLQVLAAGWRFRAAATVQSSLSALDGSVDGAIVDLALPDGSGFDVISAARSLLCDIPMLAPMRHS